MIARRQNAKLRVLGPPVMHVAEHKQMRGRGIIDFRLFLKIRRHQDARQGRWLAVDRFEYT